MASFLMVDDVIALHQEAIRVGGVGTDGIRSEHLLSSAVFQPQQSFGGDDLYPTVPEKAAAYGFFIAENQPFLDGNKRTAALALTVFLDINGYELVVENEDELAIVFEDLGKKAVDQSDFFHWVCQRAFPIQRAAC